MRSSSRSGPISGSFLRPDERSFSRLSSVRWSVLLAALALSVVGAATVHSAAAEMAGRYLNRQLTWIALGTVALIVALSVDYRRLSRAAVPLYAGTVGMLALVLVVGRVRGGARSWLGFGSFQLQPTELAKLATALIVAKYLAGREGEHLTMKEIGVAVSLVALPASLIAIQPDLGSAAMLVPMLAAQLLVAGIRPRRLVAIGLLGVVLTGLGWTFGLQEYQRERIATFVSPGSDPQGAGYQVRQSKIAVGSGELLGTGYQRGTQSQLRFLPARHTDFVFAVLAEEWGFLGVAFTMALYGIFLYGVIEIASRARDRLGILLVMGLFSTFAFHIVYNTGMVIGLLPITGIPLPFLSYGGSFALFCFAATGLILGVDARRYVNR